MESRLHLLIVSAFSKKNLDELQKLRMTVNQMSQTSNWNIQYCCGEFLHSSDVVSVRELKFCEGCGHCRGMCCATLAFVVLMFGAEAWPWTIWTTTTCWRR